MTIRALDRRRRAVQWLIVMVAVFVGTWWFHIRHLPPTAPPLPEEERAAAPMEKQAPAVDAERAVRFTRFVTHGGMTVLFSESHAAPIVRARLLVRAGPAYDPPGKSGVSNLTARLMTEGAGPYDRSAFNERLDYYGIELSASAGVDAITIDLTTLTDHLDEAWSRLADLLIRPRFEEKDWEREKSGVLSGLIKAEKKPSSRASKALKRLTFGERHPYGHPRPGTRESVESLQLEDVKAFHREGFKAAGMVLAVAGDLDLARLKALLDRDFAALNQTAPAFGPLPYPIAREKGGRAFIEMNKPQTTFRLGMVGIDKHDPDYFPALVMNHILGGGGFTSRLTEEIREKRGLAYSVYSYLSPRTVPGPLVVGMNTKTASAAEALKIIRHEIGKMAETGVSDEELEDARLNLTGSFPMRLDGLGKIVSNLAGMGFHRLPDDYLDRWPQKVRAVTREDVLRVAKRLLKPGALNVVIVGKEDVQIPLEKSLESS